MGRCVFIHVVSGGAVDGLSSWGTCDKVRPTFLRRGLFLALQRSEQVTISCDYRCDEPAGRVTGGHFDFFPARGDRNLTKLIDRVFIFVRVNSSAQKWDAV